MSGRTAIFAALLLLAAGAPAVEIYKWVDEDGVVHYSDQPVEGAEVIVLPDQEVVPPRRSAAPQGGGASGAAPERESGRDEQPFRYESLRVASPAAEETLWNIDGTLTVRLALEPPLRPQHRLRVYYDGEPQLVDSTQFELTEVWRGEHNLQAEVVDSTGQLMIRSEPIRFYVHQTSILNP